MSGPCQLSDTSSWKPKYTSIVSVIKLGTHRAVVLRTYHLFLNSKIGNAHCLWCYVPLFGDPSKPKDVSIVLKEIRVDIDSINHKCDNFKN